MPKKKVALVNIEGLASQEDIKVLVTSLVDAVREMQKQLRKHLDTKGNQWGTGFQQFNSRLEKALFDFNLSKQEVTNLPKELINLRNELEIALGDLEDKIPTEELKMLGNSFQEHTEMMENMHEEMQLENSAEKERDRLQSLEGDERLDKSAIKGLEDLERQVTKQGGTIIAQTRGSVKLYDLSSSLDGVTTTFSLPAFWEVIDVKLYSVPVLRPTVDYNIDGSLYKVTFTSEIDPSTHLAAGQKCLVIYAEA